MNSGTTELLSRIEWPEPVFDADAVAGWTTGRLALLTGLGLLSETTAADWVRCDGCDSGHVERVEWLDTPERPRRAFVPCPEHGYAWVAPERLRRWELDRERFAAVVADAGGIAGGVTSVVPDRVWRLGKTSVGSHSVVAYLARGLGWDDATDLVARAPSLQAPGGLVLVPSIQARRDVWGSVAVPPVVALTDLLVWTGTNFVFDRRHLAASFPLCVRAQKPLATFPTPAGTGWGDLVLVLEGECVTAQIGTTSRRFHFADLGLADERSDNTSDRVWALLRLFAAGRGAVPSRPGAAGGVSTNVKQAVSALNKRLREVFQIDGRPIQHTAKQKEYRARFTISGVRVTRFPLPTTATWEDVTLTELADGRIEVAVDVVETGAAFETKLRLWEPTREAAETARRLTLQELGLADAHGTPDPTGQALLVLLRGGGTLGRTVPERVKLALGAWLTAFFDLPDPFEVAPSTDRWTAKLAAGSHNRAAG